MASKESEDVLQHIKEFGAMFSEILHQFRECHNFLLESTLFSKDEILEVDKCGLAFRDLGLKTTTLAKVASSQWLDTVILCYENEKDFSVSDWSQMQQQLTKQAEDLKKAFLVIRIWANSLSEQFHKTGVNATKESDEIKKRFEEAQSKAGEDKQAAERIVQAAKEKVQTANKAYDSTNSAVKKHCGGSIWTKFGFTKMTSKVEECDHADLSSGTDDLNVIADKELQEAIMKLEKAEIEFKKAKSNKEKAEMLASNVTVLLKILEKLASTCKDVATYWMTMNTTKFEADCHFEKAIVASGENLALWRSMKSDFETYVTVMTYISNTFNFSTNAKLPPYLQIHFDSLDFELLVPDSLNVKEILNE